MGLKIQMGETSTFRAEREKELAIETDWETGTEVAEPSSQI